MFVGGGAALAGLTLAGRGAGTRSAAGASPAQDPPTLTGDHFAGLGPCRIAPQQTQGPFYTDLDLVRRDITEGRPGHPLLLGVQVVDEACQPVPGVAVDVWHCDADGDYSAFADGSGGDDAGPGTRFLRGVQSTNDEGIVEFHTIYPGWYTGRAVHVHVKVHLAAGTILTTQLYFPEQLTDFVYTREPYLSRGPRDTLIGEDFIAGDPEAGGIMVTPGRHGAGTLGLVRLGIDRSCTAFERWWYTLIGQAWRCAG
jgi:protocatechuate 3,4-dioxygenase beta subunit